MKGELTNLLERALISTALVGETPIGLLVWITRLSGHTVIVFSYIRIKETEKICDMNYKKRNVT